MAERQSGNIELSHISRYLFAAQRVKGRILDAACGVGYGSQIIQAAVGVDISEDAIQTANAEYPGPTYIKGNLEDKPWQGKFDAIVSFETLEHLQNPEVVLRHFAASLEEGGRLLCSVPNEQLYPFDAAKFAEDVYPHIRHYTPEQFDRLLRDAGFDVTWKGCNSKDRPKVSEGTGDRFLIYECQFLP